MRTLVFVLLAACGGTSSSSSVDASADSGGGGGSGTGPVTCRATGDGTSTITFINNCSAPLTYRGSKIEGGVLQPGAHACHDLGSTEETLSALRYWGFVGEDPGGEHHTLAELTLNTDFNDFDWYNISHVDAHNLPMQIVPVDKANCRTLTCAESLLPNCPDEGKYRGSGPDVISCVSPDRNNANSPVAQYFEAACDDAYSWSGDDAESVVACAAEDFDVVFCP